MADVAQKPKRRNRLEKNREKVLAVILEGGHSDGDVAAQFGVTPQAVQAFRRRNAEFILPVRAEVLRQVTDFAIAHKVTRIADLQLMHDRLLRDIRAFGVMYTEMTRYGSKRHLNPAVTELRLTLRQAAEEMDQLPRAGITVNNQNVVIVKQIHGGANPELD